MLNVEGYAVKKVLITGYEDKGLFCINSDYMNALLQAGVLPVLLPVTDDPAALEAALSDADGLVLSGGGDVEPALYGEERDPLCGPANPVRDRMEMQLCRLAHQKNIPTLGICRGIQVMNCVLGGNLYQHVAAAQTHQRTDVPRQGVHTVSVKKGTLLHRILNKEEIAVNSRHHQAVNRLGQGFVAAAHAPDGLTEGAEDPSRRFFLGVQWHPESMYEADENARNIFAAFAAAVKENT